MIRFIHTPANVEQILFQQSMGGSAINVNTSRFGATHFMPGL